MEFGFQNLVLKIGVIFAVLVIYGLGETAAHVGVHGHSPHDDHHHHHHCGHGHHDHHDHHDDDVKGEVMARQKLPEELAEEEDLKLYGFGGGAHHHHHHHHDDHHHHQGLAAGDGELSGLGLWIHAMGCSLLVSLASLICLIILPLLFIQGKPSRAVVDSLALFGAGAMLGDAFLHQLPHAFGSKEGRL